MPPMGMKVATADTNGAAAIIPRPKNLPPVVKKTSAAAKYSSSTHNQIVPLGGLDAAKTATKLGIGEREDKTGLLLKCIAVWAAALTLLWAATGVMVWSDRAELAELRSELSLLRSDVAGLAIAANESRAEADSLRGELQRSHSVVTQLGAVSAGRNETRLREELEAEIQELREEVLELMDQRRRAQLHCGVGEYPTGVTEAPCAPCPANTFSSSGLSCLECPPGLHPDALASRCTEDEDDVYEAPILDYWLAVSYMVEDLEWFANPDVQDGMLVAISTVLQIEREELVNEAMEPTTGQVVFEMVDRRTGPQNRTIAELREGVAFALWNAFFLNPIINITECGLALVEGTTSCVRTERLIVSSMFGGAVPPDAFVEALATSAALPPDLVSVTSYVQEVDGSIQLPGRLDEIDPALSYTAGPRNQLTTALANVLGLEPSEVEISSAEEWARGMALPEGRRRLQASFFQVVRVAYKIRTEQDVSSNFTALSFYGDLLDEINVQGDAYVPGPGQAPRIVALTPVDMIVGPPRYVTTIDFEVLASGETTGAMVEDSLQQPAFTKLLNASGLLTTVSINVTAKEIISTPIPPPPPPPPKIIDADEVHSTDVTAFKLNATGDVTVEGELSVGGNVSFFNDLAVEGRLVAESLEIAAGLHAGDASFGGGLVVNQSLRVAEAATFARHVEVGSLTAAGSASVGGDVSLGASSSSKLIIRTRIASDALLFDKDGTNGSLRVEFPDPASDVETIQFPAESGIVLTTGSDIVKVGTLRAGSLGPGFGAASVTDLVANGSATLHGNVTIGDAEKDNINIIGSVMTPSLIFDEDANGIGMTLTVPDPSIGTRRDGTLGTILESCTATDEFACARAELNGTEASCTSVGACVYTAQVLEVLDACIAVDIDVCANANISMAEQNETLAREACHGSGNFTQNCTFTPFNNETKAAATCVSWSAPFCSAVEQDRAGADAQQMAQDAIDHCGRIGAVEIATSTCSSHHSAAYSCLQTHDCHAGDSHNPWLINSNENAVGSSVSFELTSESWVTGMSFLARIDRVDRFAVVSVAFSDGSSQLVQLHDDQEEHMYDIGPVLTTHVTITAISVYGSSVRPGALEVWFRAGTARENACLSAANCRYTPAVLPVEEACEAIHIEDCKSAEIHQHNISLDEKLMYCQDAGRCTYTPPRLGKEISFPIESGTVLTTASQHSTLESFGHVRRGSLGEGFGGAHVAHLTSDGASRLSGDVVMGSSLSDGIEVLGHISSPVLLHDVDSDGTGIFMHYPGDVGGESQHIAFPNETGTVLTNASDVSSLTVVSGLVAGSLEPGFGDATVETFHSTGHATFDRDVTLGSSRVSEIEINGVIQNEEFVFAAGRCAFHLHRSLTGYIWDTDACLDTDELAVASFIPVDEGAECEDMFVPGPILGLAATRITSGVCVDPDGSTIHHHLTTEETCTTVSGYLIGCTLDNCVNHGTLEAALEACKDLGPAECGGVTSANEAHFETRAGVDVHESRELSWLMSCGGELTVSIPTLEADSRIAFPEESGLLLTDTSANSSLTAVGALANGSLASSFGSASVASLESRGDSVLHHDVFVGTDLYDQISIHALITTETMTFGREMRRFDDNQCVSVGMDPCHSPGRNTVDCVPADRCKALLTLRMPQYASSSELSFPNENGTLLTTASGFSALTEVGMLTRGGIGLGFGNIITANDVNLTNASAVLALEGTLMAMSSVRLGNQATDEVTLRGTVEVLDEENGVVFGVDPLTGDTTIRGDLVLGGRMVTGSEFGADDFNVTTINEYNPGEGVSIEGVLISKGTVPEFQADSIREIDGLGRGIDVDGVLVKDGRLYVNSLCLYGSKQEDPCASLGAMVLCRSADRTTAHCVPRTLCTTFYDVGGGVDSGDGCYEFDAQRESVSVSANTITSDKILDLSILNQDIADGAVTSRNTDFTTLVLEDFGPVGRLTPNDWVFGERCLDPEGLVLELLDTETSCTETTAATTHVWLASGACLSSDAQEMLVVVTDFTNELSCEFVTSDTGHSWEVEICLDTDDLAAASIVVVDEGAECSDMFVAPGVRATLVTSGVCVASDGTTIRDDFTSENSCTKVTTSTGYEWHANGVCASTSDLVIETVTQPLNDAVVSVNDEESCEVMAVASLNTWHTGWICLAPENQALLDITWLGGCEGTQILESLTVTNTGRAPDLSTEVTGNTETDIVFKHQYQGVDTPSESGIIAVGTEGHTPSFGTYMQLSTAGGLGTGDGELQKRLRISSQGDTTIYGGVLRVEGDTLTGENARNARIRLGDEDSDKLTIGAYLSQATLQIDADGDGDNRYTLSFPQLQTPHELEFPAESGTLLTSTSDFSTLKAVDDVSSGSLAPGFGRADVASLSSAADSSLLGDTSIGNENRDSIAFTGFITTSYLTFDTDWDHQCLLLEFPDPSSLKDYVPGDYVFVQDRDGGSATFGSFLAGKAEPVDGGALVYVNDTVTFSWTRYDNLHLVSYSPNPAAECSAATQTACVDGAPNCARGLFDTSFRAASCTGDDDGSGTSTACALSSDSSACAVAGGDCVYTAATNVLTMGGSHTMTFASESDVGTYCVGGRNYEDSKMTVRVRLNPTFGYSTIDVQVSDPTAIGQLSWTIADAEGNTMLSAVGDSEHTTLNGHVSVNPDGQNYTFTIEDRGDDGIRGGGGYTVLVDGVEVASGSSEFTGVNGNIWASGFKSTASHTFPVKFGELKHTVYRDETGKPGYPTGEYSEPHCTGNVTNTVTFPSEDGTLLVKHAGETHLDGDVFLGGQEADSVLVPGRFSGPISFNMDEEDDCCKDQTTAVITGSKALRFGGDNYGKLDETIGEWCRDDDSWALASSSGEFVNTCTTTVVEGCAAANENQETCAAAGSCTYTAATSDTCTTTEIVECAAANSDQTTCNDAGDCTFTEMVEATCLTTVVPECEAASADEDSCEAAGACVFTPADGNTAATCKTAILTECAPANADESTCTDAGACSFTPAVNAVCSTTVVPECEAANADQSTCEDAGACTFVAAVAAKCETTVVPACETAHADETTCLDAGACTFVGACAMLVADLTENGADCYVENPTWNGLAVDNCAASCGMCAWDASCPGNDDGTGAACALNDDGSACAVEGGDCEYIPAYTAREPYTRRGFHITLGVTEPTRDATVTLPLEDGVLLTTASETSGLKQLGSLNSLEVVGPSTLRGDLVVGTDGEDGSTSIVTFQSIVHGANAMRFDAGVEASSGPHVNICDPAANDGTTVCTARGESGTSMFPESLAIDGVNGGAPPNRWLSSDSTPYHWFVVHLGSPHFVSRVRAWASRTESELGNMCRSSVQYLPFVSGEYRTLDEAVEGMETSITSPVQWENYQASGGWETVFSTDEQISGEMDVSFDTVTTEVVRINIDMSWGCEQWDSTGLFEVQVYGLPERAYTSLAVAPPSRDRIITLPDESGTLLTDASAVPGLFGVAELAPVELPDLLQLPDGATVVRIVRSADGNDGLFAWPPTPAEGQMLVVVNEDDNTMTEAGVSELVARALSPNSKHLFFYAGGQWVSLI